MITYVPYRATDTGALVEFLTTSTWPFHTDPTLDHGVVAGRVAAGEFDTGVSQQCWWIFAESTRVGFVRLFDLADPTAMFDLRIAAHCRARGYGTAAVSWLTGHLFGQRAALRRIEATTRHDNQAMRRALRRCATPKKPTTARPGRTLTGGPTTQSATPFSARTGRPAPSPPSTGPTRRIHDPRT